MKQILAYFILLASFLWAHPSWIVPASLAQNMTPQTKEQPGGTFFSLKKTGTAQIIEIITPYALQLSNGRIIQLSGLHFPDYTPENIGPLALTAMKILKDMLINERVSIYQTTRKDWGRQNRMGHQIAHLQRQKDGLWIQGTLLSLGLAQVKTSQRNPEMAAQMYKSEARARAEKLGIWEKESRILTPQNANEHINSFQIVQGRVESVSLNKNRLYINFGKNWRDDFTVSIPPAARRYFSEAGLDPLQWNGKTLRVRGWLEEYNGPNIEINHPQAIELLGKDGKPSPILQDQSNRPMLRSLN